MVIGVLQFELAIHDAESLKDKRRVVNSLRDRLHREHLVSVAEVGDPDRADLAVLAVALAARDGSRAGEVLDRVCAKLRALTEAEVGTISRQILRGTDHDFPSPMDAADAGIERELLDRAEDRA